ncbi:MAG: hypothetical protein AAF824_20300 [Bacteroidota bacterium]
MLFAQNVPSRSLDSSRNSQITRSLGPTLTSTQKQLELLVSAYKLGDQQSKIRIREEMEKILSSLLRIQISQKEQEIRVLENEIKKLSLGNPTSQDIARTKQLREMVNGVRNDLNYRKKNQKLIVDMRLKELLKQP